MFDPVGLVEDHPSSKSVIAADGGKGFQAAIREYDRRLKSPPLFHPFSSQGRRKVGGTRKNL
jgi:hypothetical protein